MTKEKKEVSQAVRFLETINAWGDSILVHIDRIEYVTIKYGTHWFIRIKGNDFDLEEHFPEDKDDLRLNARFNDIKKIIGAK